MTMQNPHDHTELIRMVEQALGPPRHFCAYTVWAEAPAGERAPEPPPRCSQCAPRRTGPGPGDE